MAGCALTVLVSSSSGPSQQSEEREKPSVVVGLREGVACFRKGVGEIFTHPDELRALPRKEEPHARAHRRTTLAAHVKPAPNATISTSDPSPIRPCSRASSSATGTEAELMFP
jgi:hypothetical protein